MPEQAQTENHATILGKYTGPGGAIAAQPQAEDQQGIQQYVQSIGGEQNHQRSSGVLSTDKPAHQSKVHQAGRGAPEADLTVALGQSSHVRAGAHPTKGDGYQPGPDSDDQ